MASGRFLDTTSVDFQAVELDGALELTRQELGRVRGRAEEEGERWRAREQELVMRLEDSRNRERKLEDQKHNLEVCLADATQQIQELKVGARAVCRMRRRRRGVRGTAWHDQAAACCRRVSVAPRAACARSTSSCCSWRPPRRTWSRS